MGTSNAATTVNEAAAKRIERKRASILKRYNARRLSSVQLTIQLSMLDAEAAVLLPKRPTVIECRDCVGSGLDIADEDGDRDRCPSCAGTGREAA